MNPDTVLTRFAEMHLHEVEDGGTPDEQAAALLHLELAKMRQHTMGLTEAQQWLRSTLGVHLHYETLRNLVKSGKIAAQAMPRVLHSSSTGHPQGLRWKLSEYDLLSYIVPVMLYDNNPGKLTIEQLVQLRERLEKGKEA